MGQLQVQKVGWWHERLADLMLAHPDKDIKDFAELLGCHKNTLYIIKNSDCFQDYWSLRSSTHSERVEDKSLLEKTKAVAEKAVDRLNEMLDAPVSQQFALSVADTMLKRAGYTADQNSRGPEVNVSFVTVANPQMIAQARQRLMEHHGVAIPPPHLPAPADKGGSAGEAEVEDATVIPT